MPLEFEKLHIAYSTEDNQIEADALVNESQDEYVPDNLVWTDPTKLAKPVAELVRRKIRPRNGKTRFLAPMIRREQMQQAVKQSGR